MLKRSLFLFTGVFLVLEASAYPQKAAPEFKLDTVVVTADAEEEPSEDSSVFRTVIDVSGQAAKSKSVAELLENSVGLKVKRYGGLGAYSVAMIRGASPNQVAVYLDGVPLNSAKTGVVNFGDIPLSNIERIEVYRGFTPPQFPSAGAGGVINLVTKKGAAARQAGAEASYGSFNTYSANATASGPAGPAVFLIHADAGHSDGNYPYKNDNGTPYNENDDTWDLRENNVYDYHSLMGRLGGKLGGVNVSLLDDYYHKRNGIPGLGCYQSRNASYETSRNTASFSVNNQPQGSPYVIAARASHMLVGESFVDRKGEIGIGNQDNESVSQKSGADVRLSMADIIPGQYAVLYASAFHDSFDQKNLLPGGRDDPRRTRWSFTLAALDEVYIGAWTLSPSVRYEQVDNDFGGDVFFQSTASSRSYANVSPKMGVSFAFAPWLTVKANAGRYFRAPDMTELFGDRGVVVGASDLAPESGTNFDIGFRSSLPAWLDGFMEATFFYTEADNLIAYVQNSQRTSIARNIGKARITGLELSGGARWGAGWNVSMNYTFQDAIDTSDIPYYNGNLLPNRPRHDLFARIEKDWGKWKAFYEVSYTDTEYLDRANFRKNSARSISNAGASFRLPWEKLTLTLEAKNITGCTVSDAIGYPLPGRSFYMTLKWKNDN